MSIAGLPVDYAAIGRAGAVAGRLNAREHLADFTRRMFPGYQSARHIRNLVDALEWAVATPNARLIVTMPPRHSKSLHVSENLPAWYLGNHPNERLICASHSQQLANTFSRRVRNKLADPRWPFVKPDVRVARDKGAVERWDIAGTRGGYVAVGVGASPTGEGGSIIIDDPIRSAADADSQTVRDALWEWFQGTLYTRLEPGGFIILTATRWHEDDLTGRLLAAANAGGEPWRHVHMPAITTEGEALWPERWPLPALERIRQAVGSRVWQAQYMGAPTAEEGAILKRDWFPRYRQLPPGVLHLIQSWDTAYQTGDRHDYSVCHTYAVTVYGLYLVGRFKGRLEFPDLERELEAQYAQFQPREVLIENKASGQSLIQSARRRTRIPVIAIDVPSTEGKLQRVHEATPHLEAQRVHVPDWAPWTDDVLDEWCAFPLGAHDDELDAMIQTVLRHFGGAGGPAAVSSRSYVDDDREDEDEEMIRWRSA